MEKVCTENGRARELLSQLDSEILGLDRIERVELIVRRLPRIVTELSRELQ